MIIDDVHRGIQKNKKRILIGWDAKIADKLIRLFPSSYETIFGLAKEVRERTKDRFTS